MIIEKMGKIDAAYEDIRWVLKAQDSSRLDLRSIHVEDGWATCTNGHRLHSADIGDRIAPGTYGVISSNAKVVTLRDDTPPFPDCKNMVAGKWNTDAASVHKSMIQSVAFYYIYQFGACFEVRYLIDALWTDTGSATFQMKDADSPLYIYDDTHTAIVMPKRLED